MTQLLFLRQSCCQSSRGGWCQSERVQTTQGKVGEVRRRRGGLQDGGVGKKWVHDSETTHLPSPPHQPLPCWSRSFWWGPLCLAARTLCPSLNSFLSLVCTVSRHHLKSLSRPRDLTSLACSLQTAVTSRSDFSESTAKARGHRSAQMPARRGAGAATGVSAWRRFPRPRLGTAAQSDVAPAPSALSGPWRLVAYCCPSCDLSRPGHLILPWVHSYGRSFHLPPNPQSFEEFREREFLFPPSS